MDLGYIKKKEKLHIAHIAIKSSNSKCWLGPILPDFRDQKRYQNWKGRNKRYIQASNFLAKSSQGAI